MIPFTQGAQSSQTQKQKKNGGYQELGEEGMGVTAECAQNFSSKDEKSFRDRHDSCTIKQLNTELYT